MGTGARPGHGMGHIWGAVLCPAWLRALQPLLLCCMLALSHGGFKQV